MGWGDADLWSRSNGCAPSTTRRRRTPPRAYGPWEQVASNVAEGLVARGHEVTLFATADSLTAGHLEAVAPAGYEEDAQVTPKVYEALHIARAMEQADRFDLLHNHFDFLPLPGLD